MAEIREDRAVFQHLSTSTDLNTRLGTDNGIKIYPVLAPEGDIFPCIVYRLANSVPSADKDGELTEGNYFIELLVLFKGNSDGDYEDYRAIIDSVKEVMNRVSGVTYGNTTIDMTFLEGERDEVYDMETYIRGRVLTYKMMLRLTS
jgi:hypothetical protein